jgi:hypothetical protein
MKPSSGSTYTRTSKFYIVGRKGLGSSKIKELKETLAMTDYFFEKE